MSAPVDLHSAAPEIITEPGLGTLMARGTTVPSDGADGFAPGCIFIHTDGSGGTLLYVNNGSNTSADFNALGTAGVAASSALTAQLTTITHTAPGTPDYALQNLVQNTGFGFATADEGNTTLSVIANLQARMAQVETALEAHGIVAAN